MIDLEARYHKFNSEVFDNELPSNPTVEWSSRMTLCAGNCQPGTATIRLSTHYHERHPDEVDNTLLHEMIHLLPGCDNHGLRFQIMTRRINREHGYEVSRHSRGPASPPRWVYICSRCGLEIYRHRRSLKSYHVCGRCNGKLQEPVPYHQPEARKG